MTGLRCACGAPKDSETPACLGCVHRARHIGSEALRRTRDLMAETCPPRPPPAVCRRLIGPPCLTVVDGQCASQAWDGAFGEWSRCIHPAGHEGDHCDGCMMWSPSARETWARIVAETPPEPGA